MVGHIYMTVWKQFGLVFIETPCSWISALGPGHCTSDFKRTMCISCQRHVDVHKGGGDQSCVDRGRGQKLWSPMDVINGWPLMLHDYRHCKIHLKFIRKQLKLQIHSLFSTEAETKKYQSFLRADTNPHMESKWSLGPGLLIWDWPF